MKFDILLTALAVFLLSEGAYWIAALMQKPFGELSEHLVASSAVSVVAAGLGAGVARIIR